MTRSLVSTSTLARLGALAVLTLTLAPLASAADACKGFSVEADKFGDGTKLVAVVQGLSAMRAVGMTLSLQGSQVELTLNVKEGGGTSAKVAAGAEVPFRFEDGSTTTLTTTSESVTKPYVSGESIMTLVPFVIGLDASQVAQLAASPVTAIRIPLTTGQDYDWDTSKRVQKTLVTAAACAQQHM